jgi:hypothetical protein
MEDKKEILLYSITTKDGRCFVGLTDSPKEKFDSLLEGELKNNVFEINELKNFTSAEDMDDSLAEIHHQEETRHDF